MNTIYALSSHEILYVGRTKYPEMREKNHRTRNEKSGSKFITEEFEFEVLADDIPDSEVDMEEKFWIDCLSPKYNKAHNPSRDLNPAFRDHYIKQCEQKMTRKLAKLNMTAEQAYLRELEMERMRSRKKYLKKREKIIERATAYYHEHRDDINAKRRERRKAAREAAAVESPGVVLAVGENHPA